MPIPSPKGNETEQEYISSCIREIIEEYSTEGQAYAVCKSTWDRDNMSAEEFSKVKFEFPCKFKEKMPEYMSRCMSNDMVRERYKTRGNRAGFCYSQYQKRYVNNIGKGWK